MSRQIHIPTELLSAYLDFEVEGPAERELTQHLERCTECHARLQALRRVATGLQRLPRAVPPPALAREVRRRVADAPVTWLDRLRRHLPTPRLQASLATAATVVLALTVSLWQVDGTWSAKRKGRSGVPQERVDVTAGGAEWAVTTSEVAGREFVLKNSVWVERGLEGEQPEERIAATSPEGRELLSRFSELGWLLEDGSRVMLRYRQATLELSSGAEELAVPQT